MAPSFHHLRTRKLAGPSPRPVCLVRMGAPPRQQPATRGLHAVGYLEGQTAGQMGWWLSSLDGSALPAAVLYCCTSPGRSPRAMAALTPS
jgi:hypothetical protein